MPRLRRSDVRAPGIHRVRRGRGFAYVDESGRAVDAATRERAEALVLPPAWRDVWICPWPNGHIQATGFDDAGRRQYRYHDAWRVQKERLKFDRMLDLADVLPAARRRVTRDLRRDDLGRERVLAAAFRMLDTGMLRVGSERYADAHGSYGLSTLLGAHARVVGGERVVLDFPGKSGQPWESEIVDPDLAEIVTRLKRRGGRARLLAWDDSSRGWRPLSAEDINADVRARTGGEFTAKDFRTLHGTVTAAVSLARSGPGETATARKRAVVQAIRLAADALGNTPAVARSSYVDPRLLDRYAQGETLEIARLRSAESGLRALLTGGTTPG
jgi:DNA topoisomerase-1